MTKPKLSKKILFFLKKYVLPYLILLYTTLLEFSTKVTLINEPENLTGSVIYASWHGRLYGFGALKQRDSLNILISQSRDGELITKIAASHGIKAIRGSLFRGGISAAKQILTKIKMGERIVFAVDGPRGPVYEVKAGVIKLAQLSQVPIIPLVAASKRKKVFNSWDRFNLPLPFNDVTVCFGEPIKVSKILTEDGLEEKRILLQQSLKDLTDAVDKYYC